MLQCAQNVPGAQMLYNLYHFSGLYQTQRSEAFAGFRLSHPRLWDIDLLDLGISFAIYQDAMILFDQRPLSRFVGGGLTGDDDMLSMFTGLFDGIRVGLAGRRVWVFAVQGGSGLGGPVE